MNTFQSNLRQRKHTRIMKRIKRNQFKHVMRQIKRFTAGISVEQLQRLLDAFQKIRAERKGGKA